MYYLLLSILLPAAISRNAQKSIREWKGGGVSRKSRGSFSNLHIPSKIPCPVSWIQVSIPCARLKWRFGAGNRIIVAAWMAGSFERVYECFLPSILSVLSKKWPLGICAALLRALHCYGLVLAKGREESPYLQCCQPEI